VRLHIYIYIYIYIYIAGVFLISFFVYISLKSFSNCHLYSAKSAEVVRICFFCRSLSVCIRLFCRCRFESAFRVYDSLYHCQPYAASSADVSFDMSTHCNTLQHTATHCNTLQHTATHCNTLQHSLSVCICLFLHVIALNNTLQHTLQHPATHCSTLFLCVYVSFYMSSRLTTHCNTRCNTLQHTATLSFCVYTSLLTYHRAYMQQAAQVLRIIFLYTSVFLCTYVSFDMLTRSYAESSA